MGKETMKEKIARLEEEVKDWEESYKKISDINVRLQEELNEFKNGTVEMVPREEYNRILKLLNDEEEMVKLLMENLEKKRSKRAVEPKTDSRIGQLEKENAELREQLKNAKARADRETEGEIEKLKGKLSRKGVEGIGRKKDIYLEMHLESCIMKGMTTKEIIGSEYQGFDGMKKVKKSTYYKWLKDHKKK